MNDLVHLQPHVFFVTLVPCILKLLIYTLLSFETTPIMLLPFVSVKFIPRNPVEQCLEMLCKPINHFNQSHCISYWHLFNEIDAEVVSSFLKYPHVITFLKGKQSNMLSNKCQQSPGNLTLSSHTYTFRLDYSRISILYLKKKKKKGSEGND